MAGEASRSSLVAHLDRQARTDGRVLLAQVVEEAALQRATLVQPQNELHRGAGGRVVGVVCVSKGSGSNLTLQAQRLSSRQVQRSTAQHAQQPHSAPHPHLIQLLLGGDGPDALPLLLLHKQEAGVACRGSKEGGQVGAGRLCCFEDQQLQPAASGQMHGAGGANKLQHRQVHNEPAASALSPGSGTH